jgi:hypothetical protein
MSKADSASTSPAPNGADTGLTVTDAAEQIAGLFSPDPGTTKKPKTPSAKPASERESERDKGTTVETETEDEDDVTVTDEVDTETETETEDEDETESEDAEDETEDEAEPTDEEARLAQVFEFEQDGQTLKVTARELIRGFRREADYTRKTQAAADEVKQTQVEREDTRKERAVYAHLIGELRKHLQGLQPAEPNWAELKASDPLEYAVQSAEWNRRQEQIRAAQVEENRLKQLGEKEQQEKQQKIMGEILAQQRVKLYQLLPHWKDPAKAQSEGAAVRAYALQAGLSKAEVDQIAHTSALAIAMIRKAMLYDRAVERGKTIRPAPAAAQTTTATPGASTRTLRNASELKRATQRLAKTGTLKDASKAIELLI